ncbi:Asp23/Gls24 family envelope stress response protein [Microlunatus parietis]|uniref:Putative alkaline shock family protein YloU n=1 Tax=Microlunatus parietis TaxID=682979 RepID=A0A7Y9I8F5_9ACTN|nr:Asp23/Gls24 family envelope stress response protein [Microlunatus parietis]NYE71933.1 putative alkaline shock family protein YloU [Microlunatus parietis]
MALTDRGRDRAEKLACGRSLDGIWERIAGPPDDHEQSCPYCTEARERLARLHQATRELTEHEATDPAMEVSPNLKASILDIARTEVRRSRLLPLVQPDERVAEPDQLTVSERALAERIRAAADSVTGVHARRCSVELDLAGEGERADMEAPEPSETDDRPARIAVTLRIAVSARTVIPEAVARVRTAIGEELARRAGLVVTMINITVEDVYDA